MARRRVNPSIPGTLSSSIPVSHELPRWVNHWLTRGVMAKRTTTILGAGMASSTGKQSLRRWPFWSFVCGFVGVFLSCVDACDLFSLNLLCRAYRHTRRLQTLGLQNDKEEPRPDLHPSIHPSIYLPSYLPTYVPIHL